MLDLLSQLYPVAGLIHVGAGFGSALDRYAQWNARNVVLIEADDQRAGKLEVAIAGRRGYRVVQAVVAGRDEEVPYFVASNPGESGLVEPQKLTAIWRNIELVEQQTRTAVTLDALYQPGAGAAVPATVNWLVVDCLPALAILRGAESLLGALDVVVARAVVVDPAAHAVPEGDRSSLDRFLQRHGFKVAGVVAERHPALAGIAYVRDWARSYRTLAERAGRRERRLEDALARHKEELAAARQEAAEQSVLARAKTEALAAATTAHEGKLAASQAEVDRLQAEAARAETEAAERLAALGQRAAELEQKLAAAEPALAKPPEAAPQQAASAAEVETLRRELEARAAQLAEAAATIATHERRTKALEQRLDAAQEESRDERGRLEAELAKAEAQIELIRDFMAR